MKIAIMQPYLFPYIGYFQLIKAVDAFVFYDDVNFIKGGWINRNKILINKKASLFTISLDNPSSFTEIKDTRIDLNKIDTFNVKFLKTISQAYSKATYYREVFPILEDFLFSKERQFISEMAIDSITLVCDYLGMNHDFKRSSKAYRDLSQLKGKDRIIEICKRENAKKYVNPIGGRNLYSKSEFEREQITINFLKTKEVKYKQFQNEFVPALSIIDVLMFNSIKEIQNILSNYELI